MAAIAIFLLVVSMVSAFHMLRAQGVSFPLRYGVLGLCTLIVIGVFGLLRLRRWGWSLIAAGLVLGACSNFYAFHRTHVGGFLLQGLFALCFFLYLARPEVRERVR